MARTTTHLMLYVDPALRALLEAEAAAEGRSLSSTVRNLVTEALQARAARSAGGGDGR